MINNIKRIMSFVFVIMLVLSLPLCVFAYEVSHDDPYGNVSGLTPDAEPYSEGFTSDYASLFPDEVSSVPTIPEERLLPRLVDEDDLLTESEKTALCDMLDEISERQKMDVVVVTAKTLGDKTSTEYAGDFFDYNGYGYGSDYDGILMLVCLEERDWAISTHGAGIDAFTDAGIDHLVDQVTPYLSDEKFNKALTEFAKLCDNYITKYQTGNAYDVGDMPKKNYIVHFAIAAAAIGILGGFITVMVMKGSLKSVAMQAKADNYMRSNSLSIRNGSETFLYSSVSKSARASSSSSGGGGGGSSTHSSSSGRSHGGSSGKF